jgi:hypothetical protein
MGNPIQVFRNGQNIKVKSESELQPLDRKLKEGRWFEWKERPLKEVKEEILLEWLIWANVSLFLSPIITLPGVAISLIRSRDKYKGLTLMTKF